MGAKEYQIRSFIVAGLSMLCFGLSAQTTGKVIDAQTALPVPFATVVYLVDGVKTGVSADVQGLFKIDEPLVKEIYVSCVGYENSMIELGLTKSIVVKLKPKTESISEVVITPNENPALRIIRLVQEHKDENNFENYPSYCYRNYFKFKTVWEETSKKDSSSHSEDSLSLLFSEIVSLHSKHGGYTQDRIIASRTAGFESPIFGQFIYTIGQKAISFYNQSIPVFGGGDAESENKMLTRYLSPLCNGAHRAYHFYLENQYRQGEDTIFAIRYFPRKGTNFNALAGTLFVSSNNYALASVIAHPADRETAAFKFKQDYELVENHWFPCQLETEIIFMQSEINGVMSYYRWLEYSVIDSISLENVTKPNKNADQVFISEKDVRHTNSILNSVRPIPLTRNEKLSYTTYDSMFREYPIIEGLAVTLPKLTEGKLSIKKFDIDLLKIYSHNRHEGSRLGIGLYTNENLIRYVTFGGFVGYGFKDKKLKYGGEIEFMLNRLRTLALGYSYRHSLQIARVNSDYTAVGSYLENSISTSFEYFDEHKIEFNYLIFPSLKITTSAWTKNITPTYSYAYDGVELQHYNDNAVQVSLHYALGERNVLFGYNRLTLKQGNPRFNLTYTRGLNTSWLDGGFSFNRYEASTDIIAYNGRIGQTNVRVAGGYIDRPMPYGLLFSGEGSKGDGKMSFIIRNTFQTMRPNEFLSDEYIRLFLSHNFGRLFTWDFLRPELTVSYNNEWGNLRQPERHLGDFNTVDKIFQEAGIMIDNILRYDLFNSYYIRFGIGGFLRLGSYSFSAFKDNFVLKSSITMSFKK